MDELFNEEELDVSLASVVEQPPKIDPEKTISYYKVTNMCAFTNIGVRLNLKDITMRLKNTEYNPEKYPACFFRLNTPPRFTALLFSNGKIIFTGARNEKSLTKGTSIVFTVLRKLSYQFEEPKVDVNCITLYGSLAKAINIKLIHDCKVNDKKITGLLSVRNKQMWEDLVLEFQRSHFPGYPIKIKEPKCCVMLFSNGKFSITGLRKMETVKKLVEDISDILEVFYFN
eukprot:GAHX01002861.1.p1 GENE.GAHX01002861.1~~GAHX01002861.1.p1  ORF type:complete len:229 (+),score=35.33 GAHX01002861.1:34-720(+)